MPHLPYSQDFLPTDYRFLKHPDNFLRDKCFTNHGDTKKAFNEFAAPISLEFYVHGVSKFVSRRRKCVDSSGFYFGT
ncbi:hypothetical protein Angca_005668, partial [Angiostrongylus cantonensis]